MSHDDRIKKPKDQPKPLQADVSAPQVCTGGLEPSIIKDKQIIEKLLSYVLKGKSSNEKEEILKQIMDDSPSQKELKIIENKLEDQNSQRI